jgi:O-succinylbenzoate synthase
MKLESVQLRLVELPLVTPFQTSFGTETARRALVVQVVTDAGEGWGECVCGAEPGYSSEFVDSAWLTLGAFLIPPVLDAGDIAAADLRDLLKGVKGHRMAKAGLELALLDAELRQKGESFRSFLGGTATSVRPGVSVGIADSVAELAEIVSGHVEEGYSRVKLKIKPGWDFEPAAAVRELLGEDFMLQVDANTAYRRDDIDLLAALDDLDLLLIEQPFDEDDLLGHAILAASIDTPICLDESIVSTSTALQAIDLQACSIINVKPGRVGGYLEAWDMHEACLELHVPVWVGGMLETGIGRAANLALATLPGFVLPGDISATDRYFKEDITERFVLHDGEIAVPDGPGLGVEVDKDALERFTTRSEVFSAGSSVVATIRTPAEAVVTPAE